MTTRLQLEHPVTELVTGLHLVRLQLAVAAGEPLGLAQEDIRLRGHAIECRVYAEDAANGFLPSSGPLRLFAPPGEPGVRNDVGVYTGDEVGVHYDPQLAKLIVHAPDRPAAIERLARALRDYAILGPTTNLPFLVWLADHPEFRAGRTSTGFIARHWEGRPPCRGRCCSARRRSTSCAARRRSRGRRARAGRPTPGGRRAPGARAGAAPSCAYDTAPRSTG